MKDTFTYFSQNFKFIIYLFIQIKVIKVKLFPRHVEFKTFLILRKRGINL